MSGVPYIPERSVGPRKAIAGLCGVFVAVALALLGIFGAAEWYAEQVSMPRYCEDPDATIERVGQIITAREPAAGAPTRSYVVAAKLLYLEPRREGEALAAYRLRLHQRLEEVCR